MNGLEWDSYDKNRHRCFMVPNADKQVYPSTLEGVVVRVADLISYIGRDIEDAIEVKLISEADLPIEATSVLGSCNRDIIDNLVMDVIHNSVDKGAVCFSEPVFAALKRLMKFNYDRIYRAEIIQEEKRRLRNVFGELFDASPAPAPNDGGSSRSGPPAIRSPIQFAWRAKLSLRRRSHHENSRCSPDTFFAIVWRLPSAWVT